MEFEPLTRRKEDYAWALEQMIACPGLNEFEIAMLQELLVGAYVSVAAFDERRQRVMTFFPGPLMHIIERCRAAGIGRKWPEYATQD